MLGSSFRLERIFLDFIFTLIQAVMLSVLFLAILDLDFSFQIIIGLVILAMVISSIHGLLCISDKFFWKFAFLLPGDIYYYILAKSESKPVPQGRKILVTLPADSDFILSKPVPDKGEENKTEVKNSDNWLKARFHGIFLKLSKILLVLSNWFARYRNVSGHMITENKDKKNELKISDKGLTYKTNALEIDESMSIVLWLHTKNDRKIDAKDDGNTEGGKSAEDGKLSISCSHCEWESGKFGLLSMIYLLLSKNLILLLGRSLIMTFLFLFILFHNPPLMIVAEPMQIQENWTEGEDHHKVISAKNIGCDLLHADLLCMNSSQEQFINAKWSSDENPIESFKSGEIKFIKLNIDNMSPPGEYSGSIVISAEAQRIIVLDHYILPSINITIGQTNTKKLVEVPFFIRITPNLNSTG